MPLGKYIPDMFMLLGAGFLGYAYWAHKSGKVGDRIRDVYRDKRPSSFYFLVMVYAAMGVALLAFGIALFVESR